ncbi:fused MFS/spermidine synthase [Alteriqipengyuania flavescens]|uniref:spermidine synthase n=1 Tax=Alteriqipengyuania flavescens TaxID=3053610 RepID=UPI0025B33CA4|nr:fused MFS/spermidine synthase [Alteriqipengyuania flavescens]WJY19568.1 fused MFS/spermidine synthase [Alteriqipengyuania flavescens]WJY25508.1 fused MFS/spermidine synthase [Alteriqipengyuania flavescens]
MTGRARLLFVVTILTGSFLLFLVQPLVARMALPLLGGAPAVWNSAMLVYQALLLGGYAYAHALSRLALRKQAMVHVALLGLAALTLPIALADLPPPAPGWEPVWVPGLFLATIGPLFFVVSAQAPLMQRWYAADAEAGDPYWLYAASNIGSFTGLLAYPILLEPWFPIAQHSMLWAAGYGLLAVLVVLVARSRWNAAPATGQGAVAPEEGAGEAPGAKTILLWLALAAVPSGLMLSTTTHLTTDIVAMPLSWVLPLGLYLLSFTFAFAERSSLANTCVRIAPLTLLLAGSLAMVSNGHGTLSVAIATLLLMFILAIALHRRLYWLRPAPERLTLFYLVMSAGGALGGLFTALIAPVAFDWVWEHPILLLAAAALLPIVPFFDWMGRLGIAKDRRRTAILAVILVAAIIGVCMILALQRGHDNLVLLGTVGMALCGILVMERRWALLLVFAALMIARGGFETIETSVAGLRERSYFGIYTLKDNPAERTRSLLHGTTIHGLQYTDPQRRNKPTSYYGPSSGVGLVLSAAPQIVGGDAAVGVVGLGTGTLACYARPGQDWTFFEIDPVVAEYSRDGTFTFLHDCTPDASIHIGDARLVLEDLPPASFDVLVIDAFSSDAIPLHLLTTEALEIYERALKPGGIVLFHISNRYIDLQPVFAAHAGEQGWGALLRDGRGSGSDATTSSFWIAAARTPEPLARMLQAHPQEQWVSLPEPASRPWTDDHASILPFIMWRNVLGR